MKGPPLGLGGEDITWPDQVTPRGRAAPSTCRIKPETSNLENTPYVWGYSTIKTLAFVLFLSFLFLHP